MFASDHLLTTSEVRAVAAAASRELLWGLRAVRQEHRRWLARARQVPDPALRAFAIRALQDKRPLLDGAALFWTIPEPRRPELLRLLVAFQILANYHDHASERSATNAVSHDPAGSMDEFVQVLDLDRLHDHYWPTPQHADGGYLGALVTTCREGCTRLPCYDLAQCHLVLAAERARTLDLEHADTKDRRAGLEAFAASVHGVHGRLSRLELTAGFSSMLTAIVSLALAARDDTSAADMEATNEAYVLVATVSALLDNYVDLADDVAIDSHNYLLYYPTFDDAVARLGDLIAAANDAVRRLRDPERHTVIVAAMTAMYLTSDGARAHDRRHTAMLRDRAGALTKVLMPALAAWRVARSEGSA